jgi:hypothetical protein
MAKFTLIKTDHHNQQYDILVERNPKVLIDYINGLIADDLYIGNYRVFIEKDPIGNQYPSEYLLITTFMSKYGGVNSNGLST